MTAIKLPSGKFKLLQKMEYYENPTKLYTPKNSNKAQAESNSLRLYKKLIKNGKLQEYEKEIKSAIEISTLTEIMNPEKVFAGIHNFCYHNVVVSETNNSTKVRLINNTSAISQSIGTLISVNTKYPNHSLNDISKCLFNFMLYDNKLSGDISKCYRKILVDPLAAKLRLFCWLEMINDIPKFIYFERSTLDSSDAPASQSVESAQDKERVQIVGRDIEQAHDMYSWPLKQLVTNHSADPTVFKRLEVNTDHVEILFGLKRCIKNNSFRPNLYLTLQGKNRGKTVGVPLARDDFNVTTITREIFARITAKMYDVLGIFLGPAIFSFKVLMGRICKLTSLSELTKPIYEIDPILAAAAYKYLIKLKELHKIHPFPSSFIPGFN